MTSTAATDARLEELCERATAAAATKAGCPLDYTPADRDGFWTFHCPLDGPDHDPHAWKGGPQARVKEIGGRIRAGCSKCTSHAFDDAYTARVLEAIGWSDNVAEIQFGAAHSRHHLYTTNDGRWEVRRTKLTFKDRRKNPLWLWAIRDLSAGAFGGFQRFVPSEFADEHYPAYKNFYMALKLYGAERFPAGPYRAVVTEGERDADTFNAVMAGTGLIATTLPIQTPKALSAHQRAILEGREVILIGDADEGGEKFREAWHCALAGVAATVRILPPEALELIAPGKDFSDHVEQQEGAGRTREAIARRLLEKISALPIAEAPPRTDWRQSLAVTKSTGAPRDSAGNAKIVLTKHPDLHGRLRFNVRSGEVEIIGAPWGDLIGAGRIASDSSIWLEETEGLLLKSKSFEEALLSTTVAPSYDPLAEMLSAAWDGVPRLDGLFTRYLRLDLDDAQAVQLARLFMGDLIATLGNELVRQRVIVGIDTALELDVAGALLGRHGVQYHGGTIRERQVTVFAQQQAALVQVGMTTVGDRQVARFSLPQMFAPFVQVGHRQVSSPVFLALGERVIDKRTAAKLDERCLVLNLQAHVLDALAADARQIIAEGVARAPELAATPVLARNRVMTTDVREARESARYALEIIYLFATRQIDPCAQHPPRSVETIRRLPHRSEVLRHIVRSQCLEVMRVMWLAYYRDGSAHEAAFNAACRALGWFKPGEKVAVSMRGQAADALGLDIGDKVKITIPGVLLTDERLAQLEAFLHDDDGLPPEGGQEPDVSPASPGCLRAINPAETLMSTRPPEGTYTREATTNDTKPRARSNAYIEGKGAETGYLEGAAAIAAVRAILAEPGPCALDFETYPTDPAWHAAQAAAAAPRGRKAAEGDRARHAAELNGRAHVRRPCVLALAHENGAEVFVRLAPGDDPAPRRAELRAMFEGRVADLVAHNALFETEILLGHGVAVDIDCTLLAAKSLYLVAVAEDVPQPVEFGLADLVGKEFGRVRDKAVRDRDWRLEESLDKEAVEYGLQDARDCLALWQLYRARLEAEGLLKGYEVIVRATLPTAAVNLAGMVFDAGAHAALVGALRGEADRLKIELTAICGGAIANAGSTAQISAWVIDQVLGDDYPDPAERYANFCGRLQARCGVTWRCTKGSHLKITKQLKPKMAEALASHFPAVSRYLITHAQWTKATKLLGTFGESLAGWVDGDARLRGQLKLAGTVTMRHSASRPNTQQLPREAAFRGLFRAPPGRALINADYDQVELRVLAIVARDEALLGVYREGRDVHAENAAIVGLERKLAKGVSFGIAYGAGPAGLAEATGISLERAAEVLERFLTAYPAVARYREEAPREAEAAGYIAIRPGRRVHYDPALSRATQAINFVIQGGCASVMMRALRRVYDALRARPDFEARLVGAIHDEILLEAPLGAQAAAAAEILQAEMRAALVEIFPEAVEQGADRLAAAEVLSSWAEKS